MAWFHFYPIDRHADPTWAGSVRKRLRGYGTAEEAGIYVSAHRREMVSECRVAPCRNENNGSR